jgi:hypothetical protein
MLAIGFRSCVNFGVDWWLEFESDSYITIKVTISLGLGFGWRVV